MRTLMFALTALLAFASMPAKAMEFVEGRHYQTLDTPRTDAPSITEFFSFYCASCYHHQAFNQMLEARWPGVLTKYHVSFLAPRNLGPEVQRAWAAAQLLEVDKEFAQVVFDRNFVARDQVASSAAMEAIFADLGVSAERLEQTMASFQVRSLSNRMAQAERRYQVSGTPTYVVNGRYVMDNRGFRNSSDFFADYLALAGYLLAKP